MRKIIRPITIKAIAVLLILSPFLNIYEYLFFGRTSHWLLVRHDFSFQSVIGLVTMLLAIFSGIGLYYIKRWGWYLFLGFSGYVTVFSVVRLFMVKTGFAVMITSLLVVVLAITIYLISRNTRLPYLSNQFRGWRIRDRIPLAIPVQIQLDENPDVSIATKTIDFSELGALVELAPDAYPLTLGQRMQIQFNIGARDPIILSGVVVQVRESAPGAFLVGLKFVRVRRDKRAIIERFINAHYTPRYRVALTAECRNEKGEKVRAKTWNVSSGGCYISATGTTFERDDRVRIELHIPASSGHRTVLCAGTVVWVNHDDRFGKPPGFGITITKFKKGRIAFSRLLLRLSRTAEMAR